MTHKVENPFGPGERFFINFCLWSTAPDKDSEELLGKQQEADVGK